VTAADERAAMVALLRTGRRPWVEYASLVEERGSIRTVLEQELADQAEPGGQTTLLPTAAADPAAAAKLLAQARADLAGWDADGIRLVTVLDPEYPPNLRAVHDRPPIVFIAGQLNPEDAKGIAVVGTRQATDSGLRQARSIAAHLVEAGYTVISGLAAGIDTAAHTAALEANGRTVAVIGTGLKRTYPPQNAALQHEIATKCAVVSQFWPDSPPTRRTFPMRNAVMSGIALASVIVEASETSGARMQARLALAQGRPVFLLASLVERQPWARDYASRPGTQVVQTPEQLITAIERLTAPGSLIA
jgi:DNA processing protein